MTHRELRTTEQVYWQGLASEHSPEYFLTVTYSRLYADRVSLEGFKFAMKAIQKRIPSSLQRRGVAAIERTWKKAAFEDQLHLHALLWGVVGNVRDPDEFMNKVVNSSFMKLKDRSGRKMTRKSNIKLLNVYSEGVNEYTTKDIRHPSRRSRVWLITPNGFDTSTDYFE